MDTNLKIYAFRKIDAGYVNVEIYVATSEDAAIEFWKQNNNGAKFIRSKWDIEAHEIKEGHVTEEYE